MVRMARIHLLCFVAVAVVACSSAKAHNLFVLLEPNSGGPDRVDVIFEHSPYPGKGTYNQPHLERGRTWVRQLDAEQKAPLELKEATRLGKKFLQTETDTTGPRVVVHSMQVGHLQWPTWTFFHGKYLDASSAEHVKALSRTPRTAARHGPRRGRPGALTVTVLFDSAARWPTPRSRSGRQAGRRRSKRRMQTGAIELDNLSPGTYSFGTAHTQKDN